MFRSSDETTVILELSKEDDRRLLYAAMRVLDQHGIHPFVRNYKERETYSCGLRPARTTLAVLDKEREAAEELCSTIEAELRQAQFERQWRLECEARLRREQRLQAKLERGVRQQL